MNNLREELAALEHEQWAHWTKYMLKVLGLDRDRDVLLLTLKDVRGQPLFTEEQVDALMRWRRQIDTPYAELTEKERDSDREWADKVFDLMAGETISAPRPGLVSSIPLEDLRKLDRE